MPVRNSSTEQLLESFEPRQTLASKIRRFLNSEDGPTAVEYAVMLALIIVVCLAAVTAVGTQAAAKFNTISTAVGKAGS
jgi:pilus assembly protein Flp/PilA